MCSINFLPPTLMAMNHSRDCNHSGWCKISGDLWWMSVTYKSMWQSGAFYMSLRLCPFKFGFLRVGFTFTLFGCAFSFVISKTLSTLLGEALHDPVWVLILIWIYLATHTPTAVRLYYLRPVPVPLSSEAYSLRASFPSLLSCSFTTAEPPQLPRPHFDIADFFFF